MARGFRVFTDNHVQQPLVDGLRRRGWDVVRAVDVFPERTLDDVLFAHAVKDGRVFVSNDEDLLAIVDDWLRRGSSFPGLVYWHPDDYAAMTTGEILEAFEALAGEEAPFAYPVRRIRPPARGQAHERFKRGRRKPRGA